MPAGIYLYDGELPRQLAERGFPLLSAQRQAKTLALRDPDARAWSMLAYLLLRHGLRTLYGLAQPGDFAFRERGKPYLPEQPHIHFNLSHCAWAALCAVSDDEVGADIQHVVGVSDVTARRVLTPEEYAAYQNSPDRPGLFCELWTRKESWLKRSGQGLSVDLRTLRAAELDGVTALPVREDCRAAAAGLNAPVTRVAAEELFGD